MAGVCGLGTLTKEVASNKVGGSLLNVRGNMNPTGVLVFTLLIISGTTDTKDTVRLAKYKRNPFQIYNVLHSPLLPP